MKHKVLDLMNILNNHSRVIHQAASSCAPISNPNTDPVFLALVSARNEEYGKGMAGWEGRRRGDFDERGYFGDAANTGR
jgi:hypothetical protein